MSEYYENEARRERGGPIIDWVLPPFVVELKKHARTVTSPETITIENCVVIEIPGGLTVIIPNKV